jgi:hypothetical protein
MWFRHSIQLLLVQTTLLRLILHPISSKSMISMLQEEGLVMYIDVGTMMVHRGRFECGA